MSRIGDPRTADAALQLPSSTGEETALVSEIRHVISDLGNLTPRSPSGPSEQQALGGFSSEVTRRANDLQSKLQMLIEKSSGAEKPKVDELMALNDSLTSLIVPPEGPLAPGISPITRRSSNDQKTRLTVDIPSYNGFLSSHTTPSMGTPNGHLEETLSTTDDSDEELSTPRLDKGKQRAAEEPKRPTPVLRRPSLVLDSEDEFVEPEVHPEAGISPTIDRSAIGNFLIVVA